MTRWLVTSPLVVWGLLVSCSEPTGPRAGDVRIVTSTTGVDADSDGYTVRLDGAVIGTIGPQDTLEHRGVPVGDHTVELAGFAGNCVPAGTHPRVIRVGPDSTSTTNMKVTCVATRAGIRVRFLLTGTQRDTNGYVLMLDGNAIAALPFDADTAFRVDPGPHELTLRGVARFCIPVGDSTRTNTLTVGDTWTVTWSVHCLRPLSGRIAYNSQSYIWTVRSDGTDPRRWALPGCWCTGAAISADGMRVAWWQQGIVWTYADSTHFQRLTGREGADVRPAWSPDGSKIAYAGKGSPTAFLYHVWLMNADGTGRVQLTTNDEHHLAPAWSPDGLHIAYSSNGNTGNREIWIMQADGSDPRQLTSIGGLGADVEAGRDPHRVSQLSGWSFGDLRDESRRHRRVEADREHRAGDGGCVPVLGSVAARGGWAPSPFPHPSSPVVVPPRGIEPLFPP